MLTIVINFLLANRYLLPAIGFLATAVAIYFRGYSSGKDNVKASDNEAEASINDSIQKIEANNQTLDQKRANDAQSVTNTDSIDQLIGVFNHVNSEASNNRSDKDS